MYQDTIVAISTPVGEGGIGIVRLSGAESRSITESIFNRKLADHRLVYGHIKESAAGEVVDEVLVAFMASPRTYTREDIVEINCHGGIVPLQRVLELVLQKGARLANPGEFTLRAFLNGRIDLTQAEAVLDVIRSKTEASLRVAMQGLQGKLSEKIKSLRSELISVLAYFTARVDFPEDDIPEQDARGQMVMQLDRLMELVASADSGMAYRQGIHTAIVGRPNVGKSSLLNCLLRENRAIVTPIPGTTRDTLEEVVNIQNIPFVLIDTAGITHSKDMVEVLGVERSRQAIESADFVLLVIDSSTELTARDIEIIDLVEGKVVLVAANKSDISTLATLDEFKWPVVQISALTGDGINELEKQMVNLVMKGKILTSDEAIVSNPRHKTLLKEAQDNLAQAIDGFDTHLPDDFITIDLTLAINALGGITGETVSEELLDTIFHQFCVGK